jgi:hypothetical protein
MERPTIEDYKEKINSHFYITDDSYHYYIEALEKYCDWMEARDAAYRVAVRNIKLKHD